MKSERLNSDVYAIHYDSFESIMSDKPKTEHNTKMVQHKLSDRKMMKGNWYGNGCHTAVDFLERVKSGWPSLVKSVKQKADGMTIKPDILPIMVSQATRRKRVRSDTGMDLDIHAVYQGQLDRAWSSTKHEMYNKRRRAAHVYIPIDANADIPAEYSEWRAATAYRVCDILQRSGFTVEVTVGGSVVYGFKNGPRVLFCTFTAKSSGMPLDLNRLCIQSTLGWFRTYVFAGYLCNDKAIDCQWSLGLANPDAIPPLVEERTKAGDLTVMVPAHTFSEMSAMQAVRKLQQQLTVYGKENAA